MGYKDGMIWVWDIVKGICEMVFIGYKGVVIVLVYNKMGFLLVFGSMDMDIIVWDVVVEIGLYCLKGYCD